MPKYIKIKTSDESIRNILDLYEEARPLGLDASLRLSDSIKAGDLLTTIKGGAQDNSNKVAKKIGGFTGIIGGYLTGAVNGAIDYFWQAPAENDSSTQDLHYLESQQVPMPDIKFVVAEKDENKNKCEKLQQQLQSCYNLAHKYQQLKMQRGIFLGIGDNYKKDTIDDIKYLANILIGHKIMVAANAGSKEDFEKHINHLENFLEKLCNAPAATAILHSKSDDSVYLSFRALLISLNLVLNDQEDKEETLENTNNRVVKLEEKITRFLKQNIKDIKTNLKSEQEHLLKLLTPYQLEQLSVNISSQTDTTSFGALELDEDKQTEIDFLQQLFGLNKNESELTNPATKLIEILERASSIKISASQKSTISSALSSYLSAVKELNQLQQKLYNIETKPKSAYLNEIESTQIKVLNTTANLQKLRHQLKKSLLPVFVSSKNQDFKNRLTQASITKYQPVGIETLENALQAVAELKELSQQDYSQEATTDLDQLAKSIHETKSQDEELNSIINSFQFVAKDEDDQVAELKTRLDESEAEKRNLEDDLKKLKSQVAKQERKIKSLKSEKKALNKRVNTSEEANQAKKFIDNYECNLQTLETIQQELQRLISGYKEQASSGILGIFSIHGNEGRERADKFLKSFENDISKWFLNNRKQIHCQNVSQFIESFQDLLKDRIRNNKTFLAGNYRDHSLNTYLLSFNGFLEQMKDNAKQIQGNPLDSDTSEEQMTDSISFFGKYIADDSNKDKKTWANNQYKDEFKRSFFYDKL